MTEIKIEKKTTIWPWILLLLGIIAVASWFFFFRKDNTALINIHENNKTVATYVAFIESDTNTMSLDHAYTSEAITKLTNAIDAMAGEIDYNVKADTDKAKQLADEITIDPLVTTHGDKIRIAADILSTALLNIQQAKYPSLSTDAGAVKDAASAISAETLTLDQRDAVKSFFRTAADLLNKMN